MLFAFVPDPLRLSVGDSHAQSEEARLEFSFGAKAPADFVPLSFPQHVFGGPRQDVWNRLTRAAALRRRGDHLHIGGIDIEMAGNADGPAQFASRKLLAEPGALAV